MMLDAYFCLKVADSSHPAADFYGGQNFPQENGVFALVKDRSKNDAMAYLVRWFTD